MRFSPAIDVSDLEGILARFVAIAGWDSWKKRSRTIASWCTAHPFLEEHFRQRHSTEIEIANLWKRKLTTGRFPRRPADLTPPQASALGMAVMVVRVHHRLSNAGKTRLAGMVRDSLKSHRGFLSLQFEMATARNLLSRGFDVIFHDLEEGGGFDFLVSNGEVVAEAECKTVSYDLGRKVHRKVFHHLAKILFPRIAKWMSSSDSSLKVDLVLTGRLPSLQADLEGLAEGITSQVQAGPGVVQHQLGEILVTEWPVDPEPRAVAVAADQLREEPGIHALAITNLRSSIALTARSTQAERVLEGIYQQLKTSAKQQLTASLPGLLFAMVEELDPVDWAGLVDDSGLREVAEALFADSRYSHVHSVRYSSEGEVIRRGGTVFEQGPQVVFINAHNPMRDDPLLMMEYEGGKD